VNLPTARYLDQVATWPTEGRHILAHYDADSIVVYQAYRPSIGEYAVKHCVFGGGFSYARMSWIKPNFLWMMYRSGWGTKEGQEVTLGLRLRREFFDSILVQAVASSLNQSDQTSLEAWKAALASSNVRLQWDPDHHLFGGAVARRAIQLGLRGPVLEDFGQRELLEVIDMTAFVCEQRALLSRIEVGELRTPVERVYVPDDVAIARRLKLDRMPAPLPREPSSGVIFKKKQ
jgi:Domain of unknown function (DUF4291)